MKTLPKQVSARIQVEHKGLFSELNALINRYLDALNAVKVPVTARAEEQKNNRKSHYH